MSQMRPQTQAAFMVVAPFAPTVTSVMHGGHAQNSAHYDGRAVDVGAFGGTSVGWNAPTWNALVNAIASHRFSKIGTTRAIALDPQLQHFAQANGVVLFEDEGSGPHVHFEVAPVAPNG